MKRHLLPLMVLLAVNGLAHFIPFERVFLSLDDVARWLAILNQENTMLFLWQEILSTPDRPLLIFHYALDVLAAEKPLFAVSLVFLSSTALLWAVYLLLNLLLERRGWAFLCALFYLLLPNKLALYHTLTYTYLNVVFTLYVASLILFILYTQRKRWGHLAGSFLCYTTALFMYELGFFLPLVLLLYAWLKERRSAKACLLFLIPVAAYLLLRFDVFGWVASDSKAPDVQLVRVLPNIFSMLPQLYLGRQMAKWILYGLYRFPTIEAPWIFLLVAANALFAAGLWRWLKRTSFPKVPAPTLGLAAAIFILLVAPVFLTWGILGRHTGMSSIGFVLLIAAAIPLLGRFRVLAVSAALFLGLVVSQGTAWNQVVACRINRAICDTLTASKEALLRSERVLIDQASFSRQIPYTWVQNSNDQLDTYWGVEALLGRGFPYLVHLVAGEKRPTHVVRSPITRRGAAWVFQVYNPDTYRLEEQVVPRRGTFLLDYEAVYPNGFRSGKRVGF